MTRRTCIADILARPDAFIDTVVNVDGALLVAGYDRARRQFQQVWLADSSGRETCGMRALPIHSDSTLWHGLSRLSARHLPGYQQYRVHDAVRAWVRVVEVDGEPRLEVLTAAVFREAFTLFVGDEGVRLEQALADRNGLLSVADIARHQARYLNRACQVYGTLTLKTAPAVQYLAQGKLAYITDTAKAAPPTRLEADWLDDIAYPQSDSRPEADASLAATLHIDPNYGIMRQLRGFPGINQTSVKPAIVAGKLVSSGNPRHFAGLTDICSVYLQNIRHDGDERRFESVIKLKNFGRSGA